MIFLVTFFGSVLKNLSDASWALQPIGREVRANIAYRCCGGWMNKCLFVFLIASSIVSCGKFEARKSRVSAMSSDCSQKLSGVWEFGRAPFGCALDSSSSATLLNTYKDVVYNEKNISDSERKRFVQEMHSFLSDYSAAYLKRREPNATSEDLETWKQLILATAHQESYWTQYRFGGDGVFRFFRGDGGHGYGIMQIDDRWHKEFIASGDVYDLEKHFVYALDMLYDTRKAAIKTPCVAAGTSGTSLNRTIYSAYNGGPRSRCRWQSSGGKWSRNDKGFNEKLTAKAWEKDL